MSNNEFDVIIIGGGITGAGTQRDCAMRGLKTLLIERSDIATGATGRNHGLLHSGARYAVNDPESAEECIKENMILRRIASHCVDPTDGLFISLPEDDLSYQQTFVDACRKAGISAEVIDPELAKRLEPSVNPELTGAVRVPDGSVDPFRLCAANMLDAKLHGGQVRLHTEVTGFIFPVNPGPMVLGDLLPAINLAVVLFYFMRKVGKTDIVDYNNEKRNALGFITLGVALIHLLFPSIVII